MKYSAVIAMLFVLAGVCLEIPAVQADATGSLQGMKWLDVDANGSRDDREPGLPGVTIYIDLNNNGVFDSGEPVRVTMIDDIGTTKNETGHYHFADVAPGAYVIREVVADGFVQTFPPVLAHQVVVENGKMIEGLDFGNQPVVPGALQGLKWYDSNGDGKRDPDEPGLPDVVIYLDLNGDGVRNTV